jgi:hypothetical protein
MINEQQMDIYKMCVFENPNNFDLYHYFTLTEKYENQKNYFYVSETNVKYKFKNNGKLLDGHNTNSLNNNNSSINKGIKNITKNKSHKRNRDIILINDDDSDKFDENNSNLSISKINWCPLCLADIKHLTKKNKSKHLKDCKKPFI